jgi:hypothetical protein
MLMSPYHYDGYLDPTSVENRIWGDGIGTSLFDDQCDAGSLWLVIIPKSKDRFMEGPPMKIVQP